MSKKLTGYTALVTGGSKGIGAAIVFELAQQGANVAFCARESKELRELEQSLSYSGLSCLAIPVDVFCKDEISYCVKTVYDKYGSIDLLVNNVGGAIKFGSFFELEDEDWLKAYEFNVLSTVRFCRSAIPYIKASKLKKIINISSISGNQPGYYNPHYTATKAAITNLGKHLSNVLADDGVLVNTVCPGSIHSFSWEKNIEMVSTKSQISFDDAKAMIEKQESSKIPLKKIGEGHHIASLVAFLASPESDWVTGSCFHINGGKLQSAF